MPTVMHECDNCDWTGTEDQLRDVLADMEDLFERIEPGHIVPSGDCPECGANCYPVEEVRPVMRLSIFAHHVAEIVGNTTQPGSFTLAPCEGVRAEVVISQSERSPFHDNRIHDTVSINGVSCGNRQGGVAEFTRLVCQANPNVIFD